MIFDDKKREYFRKNREFKEKYNNQYPNDNYNSLLCENEITEGNIIKGSFSEEERKIGLNLIELQKKRILRIERGSKENKINTQTIKKAKNIVKRPINKEQTKPTNNLKKRRFTEKLIEKGNDILKNINLRDDFDDLNRQKELLMEQKYHIKKNSFNFDFSDLRNLNQLDSIDEVLHEIRGKEKNILENKHYRLFGTKSLIKENFTKNNFSYSQINTGLSIIEEKESIEKLKEEKDKLWKEKMHEKIKKDLEEKDKKLSQVEQAKHRLGR
jgi:hypothetical protein